MRHPAKLLSLATLTAIFFPMVGVAISPNSYTSLTSPPPYAATLKSSAPTTLSLPTPSPYSLTQTLTSDRKAEADRLFDQGNEQLSVSQFREAIQSWEAALSIYQETRVREAFPEESRQREGNVLANLGIAYGNMGQYQIATNLFEQSLIIARETNDLRGEGSVLGSLGNVSFSVGQYQKAIGLFEQFLAISREIEDLQWQGIALNNLGAVYVNLGQYQTAIEFYEQYLAVSRETNDRFGEGTALSNIGGSHGSLGQYQAAIDFLEQSLVISREIEDLDGEGTTLGNLSVVHSNLGQYQQAIDFSRQQLAIAKRIGDRPMEGSALGALGTAYFGLGQFEEALNFYERGLTIVRGINDRTREGTTLSNIAELFNAQAQPELAIAFLKLSVEVREAIRSNIRGLDTDLQQSFTDTVANDYRLLADLLLEQGRIPEAQQVLDLLKLEELREFTNTRAIWSGEELQYTAVEQPVIDAHGSLIALGSAILTCEDTDCPEIDALYDQRDALTAQYNDQVDQFAEAVRANRLDDSVFQDPEQLGDDAKALLSAYAADGQTPVLIYPFVLEDKLWLVWAIEGRVIGSAEVPVPQGELASAVQRFGELLKSPTRLDELQTQGQQLYDWIIQPLAEELETNDIDHLIFVNDRVTRYIPMAALYDGEQFLLERFQISTVLAPGVTNTSDRLGSLEQSRVLGLGLSTAVAGFTALPAVELELNAIVRSDEPNTGGIYPGQVFLNDAFTFEALKTNVRNHQILHLATHAAFVPGRADESFIVLGNGDRLTAGDIEDISARLDNLHLVILSACETALGGSTGDGTEITGISSYFLGANDSRAETVIASLWAVNDNSTSVLMQRFYELLATGELTKAEALRQAQLSLLYDEDTETRLAASRTGARPTPRDGFDVAVAEPGYRHPYYWAPFILIGNGL